jgi:hypothetical protein
MKGISRRKGCKWCGEDFLHLNMEQNKGMSDELEDLFQLGPYRGRLLPTMGVTDRMLPAIRGHFVLMSGNMMMK